MSDIPDALTISETVVVRHGSGGMIALRPAIRRPGLAAGIVLVDTPVLRVRGGARWGSTPSGRGSPPDCYLGPTDESRPAP